MRKGLKIAIGLVVLVIVVVGGYFFAMTNGFLGNHWGPGVVEGEALPAEVVESRARVQRDAARALDVAAPRQVLFGDLHVHTTYSTDAFLWALPMLGGSGAHPIADACDFARYCAALDFWSITDHAEASTPQRWQETKDTIRQCNALAGDGRDPDVTAFLGFEWTQVGTTPLNHYGHKNVIFKSEKDNEVPPRPIASTGVATQVIRGAEGMIPPVVPLLDFGNRQTYYDFMTFIEEARAVPDCDADTPSKDLPVSCFESAVDPGDLAARLDSQGVEKIIIPHGTSWGFYTPPGVTWDKQLKAAMRPDTQEIVEVMSGHGNSERYKTWRAVLPTGPLDVLEDLDRLPEDATVFACPQPTRDYLPSCWRAGEIIQKRCLDEGLDEKECDNRAAKARQDYANMGIPGHLAIPGVKMEEWLDSGQCRDCFVPSFNYRPGGSVQYGLAAANFDNPDTPRRFRWGFIASSDNHRARPGTGYKEYDRKLNTESGGPPTEVWADRLRGAEKEPVAMSQRISPEELFERAGFNLTEGERQASFFVTGGLAAVHSEGRSREEIWDALKRREIYGTSGPRIMLWFDMTNGANGKTLPMGSEVTTAQSPSFRVRAAGSLKQKPGCPDFASQGLPSERLESLCSGECYNPSAERNRITRIEIVRITPQNEAGEDVDNLIEDPWRTFSCPGRESCSVEFDDPGFAAGDRDRIYYARAIQEPQEMVNAANLRCEYDENGVCVKVNPCFGDYRTSPGDACLAPAEPRAWSSPIFVDHAG